MDELSLLIIPALVGFGIWGYAIKRLGLLLGLSVGWIPAGIAAVVVFFVSGFLFLR